MIFDVLRGGQVIIYGGHLEKSPQYFAVSILPKRIRIKEIYLLFSEGRSRLIILIKRIITEKLL